MEYWDASYLFIGYEIQYFLNRWIFLQEKADKRPGI